jgi:hypothetical protein
MKTKKKVTAKRKVLRKDTMIRRIKQETKKVVKATDVSERVRTGALVASLTVVDFGWYEFSAAYFDALSESEGIAAILLSEKILDAMGIEKRDNA